MKKIFCPKCDTAIPLSREHLSKLIAQGEERISLVCPQCAHQLNLRLRLPQGQTKAAKQSRPDRPSVGHLVVLENVFGYKQLFSLFLGDNHIGRRNRYTRHHGRPEYGQTPCLYPGHRGQDGTSTLRSLR